MLSGVNTDYYRTAPWMIIFPGLAVSIAVFSFNLFGDSCEIGLTLNLSYRTLEVNVFIGVEQVSS